MYYIQPNIKPNYLYSNHAFHVISKTVGDAIFIFPFKITAIYQR